MDLRHQDALNKGLLPVLDKAQGLMKLNPEDKKRNVKILDALLTQLCDDLKQKNLLFKKLYNRYVYSGSYYDDLRIKSPDEFDINIVFVLPKKALPYELKCLQQNCAFVGCCVEEDVFKGFTSHEKDIAALFSEYEGYHWLDMKKVRRWLQSLLARTRDFSTIPGIVDVKFSESGPAKTLYIITRSGRIDVDLVPVFESSSSGWYRMLGTESTVLNFMMKKGVDLGNVMMCLVPKEHKPLDSPLYWRVHFPYVERQLMNGTGCLKPTIRLLKLLRDNLQWSLISSYALKTLVISQAMERSDSYWDKKRQGIIFYEALDQLRQALLGTGIRYIYCSNVDLLQSCRPITRENYASRLKSILRGITSEPQSLMKYFDTHHLRASYVVVDAANVPDTASLTSNNGLPARKGWTYCILM